MKVAFILLIASTIALGLSYHTKVEPCQIYEICSNHSGCCTSTIINDNGYLYWKCKMVSTYDYEVTLYPTRYADWPASYPNNTLPLTLYVVNGDCSIQVSTVPIDYKSFQVEWMCMSISNCWDRNIITCYGN